jgi:hypothetical protein
MKIIYYYYKKQIVYYLFLENKLKYSIDNHGRSQGPTNLGSWPRSDQLFLYFLGLFIAKLRFFIELFIYCRM